MSTEGPSLTNVVCEGVFAPRGQGLRLVTLGKWQNSEPQMGELNSAYGTLGWIRLRNCIQCASFGP